MNLNDLRPHIESRLAHELGVNFLDDLPITIKNKLLEKDNFVNTTYSASPEIAKQESPKFEPGLLMVGLFESAERAGHMAMVRDTAPKGHVFVQIATPSCHLMVMRRYSSNTQQAHFYVNECLANTDLLEDNQADLLAEAISLDGQPLSNLLFVCASIYWDQEAELIDVSFILPHPINKHPLMQFSLDDLRKSALQPMTKMAEESILVLKKRLGDADDQQIPN